MGGDEFGGRKVLGEIQTTVGASPMHRSRVRSRLKAQLTKFTSELTAGLSKPLREFVGEMLFGLQASSDVKLSNLARSLEDDILLINTEDHLSRNL